MEWLLFTYWLPTEPSRKRGFVWRRLKKAGALSIEGTGWLLPKTEPSSARIAEIARTVEEMGGTTNLFVASDVTEEQAQRTVARFREEREREYGEVAKECQKALRHIERELEQQEFSFEEVEELEGDLEKIRRWLSEVKERDFWDCPARHGVERLIGEVEARLAAFTQETYDRLHQ